ncbi:MAG TPA: histidine--tRNA ligase [Candidatus Acidoferrales bacterium]|jgi:histidyl-tRNA synthetase|nr:histidine--tRNA ligase [Candidatus Acidoferrales bacterium]
MAEKKKFQAIKGTRDLLPPETELWNRVEQTAREVFGTFGFGEMRPPIFEPTELFARAVGSRTEVVGKEMYSFDPAKELFAVDASLDAYPSPELTENIGESVYRIKDAFDKGDIPRTEENQQKVANLLFIFNQLKELTQNLPQEFQQDSAEVFSEYRTLVDKCRTMASLIRLGNVSISLRPEATASVCRAYIEHGMHALPQPVKLHYTGPMFRRERPQKGRYRQFYQIGAEVLEMVPPNQDPAKNITKDAAVDAEVIEMVMAFFARLGLEGVKLEINSIGDRECRPKYVELLRAELMKVKDKLGPDSQRRIETNPLRVLDSKLESEQGIIAGLPRITDHLCANCAAQYAEVKRQLGMRGVAYAENWRLVRGLDYYMRTTFEITARGLGSQNAVCGGGRYDGLVELLGGPPTKGIGFAIGEDRLILSLQEAGRGGAAQGRDVFVAWMGERAQATAITAAQKLRAAGFRVELPPVEQKFGKALGQADKLGARYALILGDDEIATGQWTVKTLASGEQAKMSEPEFLELLRRSKPLSS